MPEGTPLFVKVREGGAIAPYYEGHFRGQSGGGVSAVGIDALPREANAVTSPEYFPDYLTFTEETDAASGRGPAVVAGIWAEYPSPDNPPTGDLLANRLMARAFPRGFAGSSNPGGVRIIDSNGNSDFAQVEPWKYSGPAYAANWGPYPGWPFGFRKIGNRVECRGFLLKSNVAMASNEQPLNMPAGYAPASGGNWQRMVTAWSNSLSTGVVYGYMASQASGFIYWLNGGASYPAGSYLMMDGVSWPVTG